MKQVDFYFDFSSPFAYLASTQIEAVAARHGAAVRYCPFLLGALFKAIGTPDVPMVAAPPSKRRYYLADLACWAAHYGVPLRFPSRFPMNTVKPLRMVLALPEPERPAFIHRVFAAYWADDRDISTDDVLRELAEGMGLDATALLASTRDERMKAALRAATEQAESIGVCGAPCFRVGDLLFWGQDRLLFVEKALGG